MKKLLLLVFALLLTTSIYSQNDGPLIPKPLGSKEIKEKKDKKPFTFFKDVYKDFLKRKLYFYNCLKPYKQGQRKLIKN